MPPSPWLSARITKERYLTTTTSVSDQNTSEMIPNTLAAVGPTPCGCAKHSFMA